MKIKKIEVENFRLLRNFSIDIEDELSLIIGKNNCGKTSLLSVLDKFLNKPSSFSFNDFNLDFKGVFFQQLQNEIPEPYTSMGISTNLWIEYCETDNLSNVSKLMMDLDPDNNQILLKFEYIITEDRLKVLKKDLVGFLAAEEEKSTARDTEYFLTKNHKDYFKFQCKTVDLDEPTNFIDLEKEKISLKNVIAFEYIKANRDVSNKEPDKALSSLSSKIYDKLEAGTDHDKEIEVFKDTLSKTDDTLSGTYDTIFKSTLDKVKEFGGLKPDDTEIRIASTLQHQDILKGNTTVVYKHDNSDLPESYNGLGYMNLISMIFEIEILINKFKRAKSEKPADLNLLFIEEPEAHTHPQMQYVFINNIKNLLKGCITREDGEKRELQYLISTHSSHIVAESDFNDIKYLKRDKNNVEAKNLRSLEKEYGDDGEEENYKFLKQYLTLHRAELFFAEKAIFIEGDTERILLPAMMKKIDQEFPVDPMLSQNISIVEVGNYSHIFEKFINFFGLKSLIITDVDSEYPDTESGKRKACRPSDSLADKISNSSLKFFYGEDKLTFFSDKVVADLVLAKNDTTKKWESNASGYLVCTYQTEETNVDGISYWARSFEDAFFHLNKQFINDKKSTFISLKNKGLFDDSDNDPYTLAEKCIGKKPPFAIEILLNSSKDTAGNEFSNWETPDYIKQGLIWLKDVN